MRADVVKPTHIPNNQQHTFRYYTYDIPNNYSTRWKQFKIKNKSNWTNYAINYEVYEKFCGQLVISLLVLHRAHHTFHHFISHIRM